MLLIAILPALLLAAWAFAAAAMRRRPGLATLLGVGLATLGALFYLVFLITRAGGGASATFVGYALTALLLPYGSWAVAKLEPTRYGNVIVGVGALVLPVLILRMGQTWVVS